MKKATVLLTALFLSLATTSFAATASYPEPTAQGTNINGLGIGQNDRPAARMAVLGNFTGDQFPDFAFTGGYSGSDKHIYIVKGSINPLPTNMNIGDAWTAGKLPVVSIITEPDMYTQCGRFIAGGGDFDGDKINDLAFTCQNQSNVKTYYLVYGAQNLPAIIKTTDIGTVVRGAKFTFAGPADSAWDEFISFGDVDGDGKSELTLGYGIQRQLYVLKGGQTLSTGPTTLSDGYFNGNNGWVVKLQPNNGTYWPYAIVLNDENGDGRKDFVFGQVNYVNGGNQDRAFLIRFGKPTMPALMNVTDAAVDGVNIARINAGNIDILDLAAIDDVNGDGLKDIMISDKSDYNVPTLKVLFSKFAWSPTADTVNFDGNDGSVIDGLGFTYLLGLKPDSGREAFASTAGDFDGDGIKDILIGSQYSKRWNGTTQRAVILMGQRVWPAKITLNSTTVNGTKAVEFPGPKSTGYSVAYIENIYGGIGCGLDSSYLISAPYSQGSTGNLFISNFKK